MTFSCLKGNSMTSQQQTTILLMPRDSLTNNVIECRVYRGDFIIRFDETVTDNVVLDTCREYLPESATLEMRPYLTEEGRTCHIAIFSVPGSDIGSIKPIEVTIQGRNSTLA